MMASQLKSHAHIIEFRKLEKNPKRLLRLERRTYVILFHSLLEIDRMISSGFQEASFLMLLRQNLNVIEYEKNYSFTRFPMRIDGLC